MNNTLLRQTYLLNVKAKIRNLTGRYLDYAVAQALHLYPVLTVDGPQLLAIQYRNKAPKSPRAKDIFEQLSPVDNFSDADVAASFIHTCDYLRQVEGSTWRAGAQEVETEGTNWPEAIARLVAISHLGSDLLQVPDQFLTVNWE